jgi:hypothetical protein
MWAQGFEQLAVESGTLAGGLLRRPVLPTSVAYKRASTVMAARLAVTARQQPRRLVMMAPPPAEDLPRLMAAGLLIAHLVHEQGGGVPRGEAGPLLEGDLLLVTHAVGTAVEKLRELRLGDTLLSQVWPVESYSHYTPAVGDKPRMFVANAGWVLDGLPGRQLAAVVIDATHPRTLARLPQLLQPAESPRIQIVVTPPLLQDELVSLGYPEKAEAWSWDPEAQRILAECVTRTPVGPSIASERRIWFCDHAEMDTILAEVHELLATCQRGTPKPFLPLWEAWSLYHRLRQLAVPLAQSEDASHASWGAMPLRRRLERLRQEWTSDMHLEACWPQLTSMLQEAYDVLLACEEPPKFWVVAERVADLLGSKSAGKLRIVVPTEREGAILSLLLGQLEEGWLEAQQEGQIEVVTQRDEARLAARGQFRPTLLLGFRVGAQRYLDLYPPDVTDVIAYPYEAGIDEALQERIYGFAERLQENEAREAVLGSLGFARGSGGGGRKSLRPKVSLAGAISPEVRKAKVLLLEPSSFDLERLAGAGLRTAWDEGTWETAPRSGAEPRPWKKEVVVRFADGRRARYGAWQSVHVYHPVVEQVRRCAVAELRPGMRLVVLVDGIYESLYDRLLEALKTRISPHTQVILELWNQAKGVLLCKHDGNRRALHRALRERGLEVDYHAVAAYFRSADLDEQGLAPQHYTDVKVLAEYSELYPAEQMIRLTFGAIQQERQRRRDAGRALHSLLRAIVTGEGYEKALESARLLGHEIAEVLAAVEVRVVQNVNVVDRGETYAV